MTRLLMLITVVTTIAMAAPAYADPSSDASGDDAHFLSELKAAGLTFPDPAAAIAAAKQVCALADKGTKQDDILQNLQQSNPGFAGNGAAKFAALAANSYCPQELSQPSKAPGAS